MFKIRKMGKERRQRSWCKGVGREWGGKIPLVCLAAAEEVEETLRRCRGKTLAATGGGFRDLTGGEKSIVGAVVVVCSSVKKEWR